MERYYHDDESLEWTMSDEEALQLNVQKKAESHNTPMTVDELLQSSDDENAILSYLNLSTESNGNYETEWLDGEDLCRSTTEDDSIIVPSSESQNVSKVSALKTSMDAASKPKIPLKWNDHATLLLVTEYGRNKAKVNSKTIWHTINETMKKEGYNFEKDQVKKKFNRLRDAFKTARDHNNQTGNDPKTCQCYDLFEQIFAKEHNIDPVYACSSINPLGASTPAVVKQSLEETQSVKKSSFSESKSPQPVNKENIDSISQSTSAKKRKSSQDSSEVLNENCGTKHRNKVTPKYDQQILDYLKERDERYLNLFDSQGSRIANAVESLGEFLKGFKK